MNLPKNVVAIKKLIIDNSGITSHELNDILIAEIKKEFQNLNLKIRENGRTRCAVSLNPTEEKFMEQIKIMFGITFTQLYTNAVIRIAKKENII